MSFVRASQWVVGTLVAICLLFILLSFAGILGAAGERLATARDSRRAEAATPIAATPANVPLVRPLAQGNGGARGDALRALAAQHPDLSESIDALLASGLVDRLPTQTTLLLPTAAALRALPPDSWAQLRTDPTQLADLFAYHILTTTIKAADIGRNATLPTLRGLPLPVTVGGAGTVRIGTAGVTQIDLPLPDGIVHAIDRVQFVPTALTPPDIDTPNRARELAFEGTFLTAVGTGEPGKLIALHSNGAPFGRALVDTNGRWTVSGAIAPGRQELVAYMLEGDDRLLAASTPVVLNVIAPPRPR